ncbi:amino acid racemase [Campylobacter insulaenigrae]|uniref:aspartate/glutamate racemase family protein n=1 Tax=Campylobacter insulaenigrae TaxID=260714 RepID=UPI002152351C|nr:amino acid racemase [Campylobacter insulaenigrae]MCR6584083.1 amino acid racemase [Campylobacter insulaenigrae]
MKTIGLIGGMSYESTLSYYKIINKIISEELGKLHSAKLVLSSLDFEEIVECQCSDNWKKANEILTNQALLLEKCGVDFILICTNTMHKCFDEIQKSVKTPIFHITQAVILELQKENVDQVLLLGTKYTMSEKFYKELLEKSGIKVFTPSNEEMCQINDIIFNELCKGKIEEKSRVYFDNLISKFPQIQGVILGCTELGLIIEKSSKKLFDSAYIHAKMAALKALE